MLPIVIVDDAQEDLLLAERVLRRCKIINPIHLLKGGAECLAYFEGTGRFPARQLPCLLLLDLAMPAIDGLNVLTKLRERKLSGDSVIIMLSGITDIKLVRQGYQLGAETFLVKPLNCDDVMQLLGSVRRLRAYNKPEGYLVEVAKGWSETSETGREMVA
jgi:two-component system, response regulator